MGCGGSVSQLHPSPGIVLFIPPRPSFVPNVIEPEIMQHQRVPITVEQFARDVSSHVVIHFREILRTQRYKVNKTALALPTRQRRALLTETKKLLVPSSRAKNPGKSFTHVSSPYMTSFPPRPSAPNCFALICASQVSCAASVDDVSDSAKLRIRSTNDGVLPVVMALRRGIVMVGEVAYAVKGSAVPALIRLPIHQSCALKSFSMQRAQEVKE